MSKKRMNTLGTILDTSGSVPKGKTGGGFARNEPRPVKAKTTEGQKTLDKLSDAIEEAKNSKTGQKLTELADKADKLLAKGDIEALQKLSASIDGLLDKGAQASGGNPAALAGLALAFALKEVFLPTNILEIIPVGKIVTKGRKVVKVLKKTEKAADGLKLAEKSAKAGKKGSKGGHVSVKRMPEHNVKCFKPGKKLKDSFKDNPKKMEKEFYKQLKKQEEGLNKMTVGEYLENRKAFESIGRGSGQAQGKARRELQEKMTSSIKNSLRKKNIRGVKAETEATKMTNEKMKTLAALHDPDMKSGGKNEIGGFGDSKVNSSIGSQWSKDGRVPEMDRKAQETLAKGGPDAKMKVKLERCK